MTSEEMWQLLAVASVIDHRTVDEPMVAVWLEAIGELTYSEARTALAVHRRESTAYLLPAHLWAISVREESVVMENATEARLARQALEAGR